MRAIRDRPRRMAPANVVVKDEMEPKKGAVTQNFKEKVAAQTSASACLSSIGDGERQVKQAKQASDAPHAQPKQYRRITMVKASPDAVKTKGVDSSSAKQRSKIQVLPAKTILDQLTSDFSKSTEEKPVEKVRVEKKTLKVKESTPVDAVIQDKKKTIPKRSSMHAIKHDKVKATQMSQPPASAEKQPDQHPCEAADVHTKKSKPQPPASGEKQPEQSQPPASAEKQPEQHPGEAGQVHTEERGSDKKQQLRGTRQVEEATEDTPNTKANPTKEEHQAIDGHIRTRGSQPPADGEAKQLPADSKILQHRNTSQVEEAMTEANNIEAAPTEEAQPSSEQVRGTSLGWVNGQGDGARRNPEELQSDNVVINGPILLDQMSSPGNDDPSMVAVVLPGDDSLEILLAGVGSLSTLVADEDLTDENYITSSVLNSSVLNFDHL